MVSCFGWFCSSNRWFVCVSVAPQNFPSCLDRIWFRLRIYHDTHTHSYHWFYGYGLELIPKDSPLSRKGVVLSTNLGYWKRRGLILNLIRSYLSVFGAWCLIVAMNGLFLMELRKFCYIEYHYLLIQEINSSRVWDLLSFRVHRSRCKRVVYVCPIIGQQFKF